MRAMVVMLALLGAGAVFAQGTAPQTAQGTRHLDNLATLLDLTDEQKTQVQAILQEQHAKMKASLEQARAPGTKPDWETMKAQHEQLQQETLQKLTPVLSAAQLKKYQIIASEMHGHFHHPGMGGHPAATGSGATPPAQN